MRNLLSWGKPPVVFLVSLLIANTTLGSPAEANSPYRVKLIVKVPRHQGPATLVLFGMYSGLTAQENQLVEQIHLLENAWANAEQDYMTTRDLARRGYVHVIELEAKRVTLIRSKRALENAHDNRKSLIANQNSLVLQLNQMLGEPSNFSQVAYYQWQSGRYALEVAKRDLSVAEASLDLAAESYRKILHSVRVGYASLNELGRSKQLLGNARVRSEQQKKTVATAANSLRALHIVFIQALREEKADGGPMVAYSESEDVSYRELAIHGGRVPGGESPEPLPESNAADSAEAELPNVVP